MTFTSRKFVLYITFSLNFQLSAENVAYIWAHLANKLLEVHRECIGLKKCCVAKTEQEKQVSGVQQILITTTSTI